MAHLLAQPYQLLPLGRGERVCRLLTLASVSLAHPVAQGRLGQVQVLGHLGQALAVLAHQPDRLGPELRGETPPLPSLHEHYLPCSRLMRCVHKIGAGSLFRLSYSRARGTPPSASKASTWPRRKLSSVMSRKKRAYMA